MTKRIITTLAAIAALIFIALGVFKFSAGEAPAPPSPKAAQDVDLKPGANAAPTATEQIPQYSKSGFIPPPSDATGSAPPEAAAPKD